MEKSAFVSRAGYKLEAAIDEFHIDVTGLVAADLGCSTGGFTDCLLQRGAQKVYAVDTAWGELHWKLRTDSRVVVLERTNALFVKLPEKVDLVTIDTAWTKQSKIIPVAVSLLKDTGKIISLIKPQYEADPKILKKGSIADADLEIVLDGIKQCIETELINHPEVTIQNLIQSPIKGDKAKNTEYLMYLSKN